MPEELREFNEWAWDDRSEWIRARCDWMRQHMTVQEIADDMTRRRLAYRAETLRRWRERQEAEEEG
jgi:hypothetical protein